MIGDAFKYSRPEKSRIEVTSTQILVTPQKEPELNSGHYDVYQRSLYTRDGLAKRSVNIGNIKSSTTNGRLPAGNYIYDYDVVQVSDSFNTRKLAEFLEFHNPSENPCRYDSDGNVVNAPCDVMEAIPQEIIKGVVDTFVWSEPRGKHMISNRFSRVGGANWELNYLHDPFDRNGFSPYNTMNQHSRQLRSSLNSLHSERSNQFGARYGSKINTTTYELIRDSEPTDQDPHGSRDTRPAVAASIHMTNRNTRHRPDWDHAEYYSSTGWSTNKPLKQEYDNFFVQHQIPQSDLQYRWITASTNLNSSSFFGFEVPYTPNQSRQNSITFPTTAPFGIAVNRA
jgi:hypothetical protein